MQVTLIQIDILDKFLMQQVHLLALQQIDLNFANKGFAGFMDV